MNENVPTRATVADALRRGVDTVFGHTTEEEIAASEARIREAYAQRPAGAEFDSVTGTITPRFADPADLKNLNRVVPREPTPD